MVSALRRENFNSDGKTDLIVSYITFQRFRLEIFLGNGDGTFKSAKSVDLHGVFNAEMGLVPADLNSDGLLDFISSSQAMLVFFFRMTDPDFRLKKQRKEAGFLPGGIRHGPGLPVRRR